MIKHPPATLSSLHELHTPRLHLRQWRTSDIAPFVALNLDSEVMRYFPGTIEAAASETMVSNAQAHIAQFGWGLWAVEVTTGVDAGQFIGFVGLAIPKRNFAFSPCVEIGWRLARPFWRKAYASEAAQEVLRFGFTTLQLSEIVSYTSLLNFPSRAVMEKIGLYNLGLDFDHPALPDGHTLQRHCVYGLQQEEWLARQAGATQAASASS